MTNPIVTVFGGTGFLGRRLVRHLTSQGFLARIASRHPKGEGIRADIRDEGAVDAAVAGAYGVVNAISLYREGGTETFQALHVKAAEQLASQAKRAGVERFIHVSGVGADPTSRSSYIRSRGEGELAVRAVFANATIVRPAVMFGDDDAFLNTIVELLRHLPAYPVFGRGLTQIQPVFVEDVAEATARALNPDAPNICELGGPRVYRNSEGAPAQVYKTLQPAHFRETKAPHLPTVRRFNSEGDRDDT